MVLSAEAALTHRYIFTESVVDIVGKKNGKLSKSGAYTEQPQFVNDVPAGAIKGAPLQSIKVGMQDGKKPLVHQAELAVISLPSLSIDRGNKPSFSFSASAINPYCSDARLNERSITASMLSCCSVQLTMMSNISVVTDLIKVFFIYFIFIIIRMYLPLL